MTGPALSMVIPLYNEVDSVEPLHAALADFVQTLQGVQVEFFDGAEVLEVTRHQRGVGQCSGRGDQGIRQFEAIGAPKLCRQACNAGGHSQLWQERQERLDLTHLLRRERAAGQQLAFGDHGDARPGASSDDILHQHGRGGIAAQMIDEDVGIEEEPGHLQPKAVEPFGPAAAQPLLIADTGGKSLAQQAGGSGHNLPAAGSHGSTPRCGEADRPLHHLQALFQRLNFLENLGAGTRCVSHALSVSPHSGEVNSSEAETADA